MTGGSHYPQIRSTSELIGTAESCKYRLTALGLLHSPFSTSGGRVEPWPPVVIDPTAPGQDSLLVLISPRLCAKTDVMQAKSANVMSAQLGQDAACQLLALPEGVLAQILPWDDWFTALALAACCRKLHAMFKGLQPPATVLDCDITRPKFNTWFAGVSPARHVFQFEWDEWADALIGKLLLKKKRASQSIGHGLAKLFRAWTRSEAAKTWQEKENPQARFHEILLRSGYTGSFPDIDTLDIGSDPDQKDFWECHLSVPNMHWDTDNRRLQRHLSTVLQPLVDALTEFANTKGPNVPHVSVLISNYDEAAFWPKYADPPPWTCHSQLETMCTCGDATAECAVKQRNHEEEAEADEEDDEEDDEEEDNDQNDDHNDVQPAEKACSDADTEFESQPSSDFDAKFEADWETMMKNLEEGIV